jgi:hypothetical protein
MYIQTIQISLILKKVCFAIIRGKKNKKQSKGRQVLAENFLPETLTFPSLGFPVA